MTLRSKGPGLAGPSVIEPLRPPWCPAIGVHAGCVLHELTLAQRVIEILGSFAAAAFVNEVVERFARPNRRLFDGGLPAVGFRLLVVLWIWLFALAVSRRPIFAIVATAVTSAIIVTISNLKHASLREPLVFSDFAMLGEIAAHPRLFYLERGLLAALAGGTCLILVSSGMWWHIEPEMVSAYWAWLVGVVVIGSPFLPRFRGSGTVLDWCAQSVAPVARRDGHVGTAGLFASLLVYWIRWAAEGRRSVIDVLDTIDYLGCVYEAIVIVQAESFVDLRHGGIVGLSLKNYDGLKRRALAAGRLDVPCVGAYTLRPESAAITGVGFEEAGFDAFHPYVRSQRLAGRALPNRLPSWRTLFLHPHAPTFFRRDRAIPRLGFGRFIDESAFDDTDRDGPYVGDLAVGRRILVELAAARKDRVPVLIQVVTMEAHDPFGPDRVKGVEGATAQFQHHLQNNDRMLGLVSEELDAEADRVLLVHYGDHIPILNDCPDPMIDSRTDYLIVELGRHARRQRPDTRELKPERIYDFIVARFGSLPA